MQKKKKIALNLISLLCLSFLFIPEIVPSNLQAEGILNNLESSDVIIIFNSGGWGDTPLEEAEDFAPIISGIQAKLGEWGYNSVVIPYTRTKDDFWGRLAGARALFNSFEKSANDLAGKVEFLERKMPDKKIILAGLSNGATLVNETCKKISGDFKESVYALAVGAPFWSSKAKSENILQLDNNGKDSLAAGNMKELIASFFKGEKASGHYYSWESAEVGSQIVAFLENKLR